MTTSTFTQDDLAYIEQSYATLAELCQARAETPTEIEQLIADGVLPQPTYVLPDGRQMFPRDYFRLVDEAGAVDRLQEWFVARFREEAERAGLRETDEWTIESEWTDYLDGTYGVCLWEVTPAAMAEKESLLRTIQRLTGEPREADPDWRQALAAAVDRLDSIERPFTDYDRSRWDYTTRQRYIDEPRSRYLAVAWPESARADPDRANP
jgi:hypothetical protein